MSLFEAVANVEYGEDDEGLFSRDINGQLGGPFIKDRLWYFTSFRDQYTALTTGMYDRPLQEGGTQGHPFTTRTNETLTRDNALYRRLSAQLATAGREATRSMSSAAGASPTVIAHWTRPNCARRPSGAVQPVAT